MTATSSGAAAEEDEKQSPATEALIPGLPYEVAEQCLLRLPYPYQALARSVSSSWNRVLSSAAFARAKAAIFPPLACPHLFVFSFHRHSLRLQWQALDLRSRRWFLLPSMPLPDSPLCPSAFASAALPTRGELYVLGGMRSDTKTPLRSLISYRATTNSWSLAAPMTTPRSFFVAGAIGDRILTAGGGGDDGDGGIAAVEIYDPVADQWAPAAGMRFGIARYDAAVVGPRMYLTEGWTWPFNLSPRGAVYDSMHDTWEEMRAGMRDGWTGSSVVVGERLFVVSEYGEGRVKVYESGSDTWWAVGGGGVPAELRRPFAVAGSAEGRIYVVASGIDMAVGTVAEDGQEGWKVEWEVVKGPRAFAELAPCSAHVLFA